MLWKCCIQYASKFGKPSSGHRTGKGQFSLQSQRKAMPKNAQMLTIVLISHASKVMLKFSKPGFNSTWTVNVQMFKPDLEKADEREIKLQTSAGWTKMQASSRKIANSGLVTMPNPLTVWITTNWGKFFKRLEYQTTWPVSWENLYAGQEAIVTTGHGTTDWF